MPPIPKKALAPFWSTLPIPGKAVHKLYLGDSLKVLSQLPSGSVHCCVTSPPYWGLRDYGTAVWEGGNSNCSHAKTVNTEDSKRRETASVRNDSEGKFVHPAGWRSGGSQAADLHWEKEVCSRCGAVRVDSQLGSEKTPQEFVANLVVLFREVRRVLRDDGTCWLNLGDSYSSAPTGPNLGGIDGKRGCGVFGGQRTGIEPPQPLRSGNLVGTPWRVALALQEDGWVLRQDIIWSKPSPMPESCKNRCTKAHEYLFLLTKRGGGYYYDAEAIKDKSLTADLPPRTLGKKQAVTKFDGMVSHNENNASAVLDRVPNSNKRSVWSIDNERALLDWLASNEPEVLERFVAESQNKGDVWRIASQGYEGAHFATFPQKLVEPCILAGTSAHGCCASCGAPWKRVTEDEKLTRERPNDYVKRTGEDGTGNSCANTVAGVSVKTIGWEPTCECNTEKIVPCTVLDLFIGSGTTSCVALSLGRSSIGIDLSEEYLKNNAIPRIEGEIHSRPALSAILPRKAVPKSLTGESLL